MRSGRLASDYPRSDHVATYGEAFLYEINKPGSSSFGTKQPFQRNVGDAAAHKSGISRQLVEQRFGVLQDRCVEAFGEPAVDRREEGTGVGALALVTT